MTNETLRDKIEEIVSDADCSDDRGYGPSVLNPDKIADAILAEIVASVPPLVWEGGLATLHNDCYYTAVKSLSGKTFYVNFVTQKNSVVIGRFPTLEAAEAAAQAHNAAQKTDWMMK